MLGTSITSIKLIRSLFYVEKYYVFTVLMEYVLFDRNKP